MTTAVSTVVLTAAFVAQATGGRLAAGDASHVFDGVTTDSRAVTPGALFIALRGDRFDGHAFVDVALRAGAGGVLVQRGLGRPGASSNSVTIEVADTLAALQALGRHVRLASGARVVAVTGSTGKTTTKEVTAEILAVRYRVFRNRGNLNNHIGLPLSLIELRHGPEIAVVELGMNHAGEIRALVGMAEPDVRVWTNVGDAHIGFFGSREAIADAKAEILEGAPASALLVANADDPLVTARVARWRGRRTLFGESAAADVRASEVRDAGFDGATSAIETPAGRVSLRVPLPGRAQLQNVLAAVSVGLEFGVPLDAMAGVVSRLEPVARRGASTVTAGGVRVVDDSYNASPAAVQAMLAALAATPTTGRRIAILGEMRELGASSVALHEACGRAAAQAGVDALVTIGGPGAAALAAGARGAGLSPAKVHEFADSAAAAAAAAGLVARGDVVLVKGSRGTRTELVADALREAA